MEEREERRKHAFYAKEKYWNEAVREAHKRGEGNEDGKELTTSRRSSGAMSGRGFMGILEFENYLGRPLTKRHMDGGFSELNKQDLLQNSKFKDFHKKQFRDDE